jgi:serine/threonine protein kinase
MKIISVVKRINQGGFGIIDEIICEDGNHYARKQFFASDQFKSDRELCDKLKNRFVREVKTQKVLPDDYFIPILFDDLKSTNPYFIMPLADDVYINEIIRSKKAGKNPEGLGDILNALEFLHDKALVHRDLKPHNILKHNGAWKLADFGLITQDKKILSQTITTSKNAFGTAMYCAPEQVVEFNRITPQADIYSFGAILHDIFTDGSRVPYSELSGQGEIGQIIAKCTRHKKEQRFQNIKSIRTKLLTLLSDDQKAPKNQSDLQWQNKFCDVLKWDEDLLENFTFYLKQSHAIGDIVFNQITEEILEYLCKLNRDLFNEFSLIYLNWVYNRSFKFDYCDVVVTNVYLIYQRTKDVEVKSKCAIAAAELGRSHNRWYVMKFVVKMSDVNIDDNLAFRIGLDIELDEKNKMNFERCVAGINQNKNSYHKIVQEALV